MNIFHAVILGIIEGFTEYLPVSSTGHLILAVKLLGMSPSEFIKSFEIVIQLGAILAVVALYWRKLLVNREIMKRVCVAFLPTAAIGFVLYTIIKHYLLGNGVIVVWALFLGGILLIVFERLHKEGPEAVGAIESISYKKSFLIGIAQSLAVIPGVSRSAATIVGGLWLGMKRETIVEFSFLLAVPTMLGATALDLMKTWHEFTRTQIDLLGIGFAVSFIIAIIGIKFLVGFIKNHTFISFGVYRIIAAFVFWFFILT